MSQEELRRERQETIEELQKTEQDVSGQTNKLWGAISRGTGWKFNYGGWYSPSFVSSDENDRDANTLDLIDHSWENDLRLFFLGQSGTGKTKLYFRVGTKLTQNTLGAPIVQKSDWVQPGIDLFYLEHKSGKKSLRHKWTIGRQFAKVKNTLAFGLVADGLSYELNTRRQSVEAFALHSMPGEDNIDFLAPQPGRSDRWFFGGQYSLKYLPSQSLNFFNVWNVDANEDRPDAEGQRHQFDSLYLGATVYGMLFSRLEYELQFIKELGKTYSDTGNQATERARIDAQAVYFEVKYYFYSDLKPVIHTGFMVGSGDADAVGNVFSSSGGSGSQVGSGAGGKDGRFISFGGKNLGYALAPTLTNLRVVKSGVSVKPFGWAHSRVWKDLKIHPQFYMYWRDKSDGATSDPYMLRGPGSSKRVGNEIDLSIAWRLMSDVNYSLKFGRFSPGPAYATRSPELFLRFKISVDL